MAEYEVTGVGGKQAYTLNQTSPAVAYMKVDVRRQAGGGAAVSALSLMSGVTTNTTSATLAGVSGPKTFWAEVVGTGAVSVLVTIYGARTSAAANGVLLATLSLSGTTQAQDAAATSTAPYPYYYAVTSGISGTSATVRVEIFN